MVMISGTDPEKLYRISKYCCQDGYCPTGVQASPKTPLTTHDVWNVQVWCQSRDQALGLQGCITAYTTIYPPLLQASIGSFWPPVDLGERNYRPDAYPPGPGEEEGQLGATPESSPESGPGDPRNTGEDDGRDPTNPDEGDPVIVLSDDSD